MVRYKKTALAITLSSAAALSGAAQAAQISAAGFATTSSPVATIGNNVTLLSKTTGQGITGNYVTMTWDGSVFTDSSDYTGLGSVSNMTLTPVGGIAECSVHPARRSGLRAGYLYI